MKYDDRRMDTMKERSSAVAMMVLHMSSQIVSGGEHVTQHCHFLKSSSLGTARGRTLSISVN